MKLYTGDVSIEHSGLAGPSNTSICFRSHMATMRQIQVSNVKWGRRKKYVVTSTKVPRLRYRRGG